MPGDYLWFEGIPFFPELFSSEVLRKVRDEFVMRDEDTIIVTFPKSGTHWLIEILCLIQNKGDPTWNHTVPFDERSPWVETCPGYALVNTMKDPRLFTSHLPIQLFPKSFSSTKAKVIYAIRNPRDALVSGYYFFSNSNFIKKPKSLEEYFEWFIQGKVPYGSWFEHIRGWMSMRDKDNFLMLSYEELKKDSRGTVEKICQFLGKQLEPKEVDLVLHYSSFHVMKENKMTKIIEKPDGNLSFPLMRKGICGEWKDHFTSAQAETFDKVFQEKMAGFPRELLPWE